MREEFRDSLKNSQPKWRLFEHEYGIRLSQEAWQSQWNGVEQALRRFMSSAWYDRLAAIGPECWKAVDEVLKFDVGGVTAYLKIDCGIEVEGQFYLMDWKTSQLRASDESGLLVSALYAHEVWGADPCSITALSVSLLNGQSRKASVNEDSLMETYLKIQENAALLESASSHFGSDPFSLPPAELLEICERCNFQKICYPKGIGGLNK
jgi:hypothetical protein